MQPMVALNFLSECSGRDAGKSVFYQRTVGRGVEHAVEN